MVVSGLDDLLVDFYYVLRRVGKRERERQPEDFAWMPEQLIALWVPAWREAGVIAQMVAHNVAALRYRRYHIFAGTYPNDEATLEVMRELEAKYENFHLSLTPHDGPTSKADNLNWIYQAMCEVEERRGERFDIVVVHDSEDLIHPEEFRWLNAYCREYDFVQVPVLALPTPWWEFTHGVYCDEFAETQQKDLPVRNLLKGFTPSCGVGTGYRREAVEKLAEVESNRLFEPDSLTEDYVSGLKMHQLGMKQIFLPVAWVNGQPVATREYFPRSFRAAVRQRSRWVTGIALQTWEKVGWPGGWRDRYWFWRDRKGLVGNPLSLVANGMMLAGVCGYAPRIEGTLLMMMGMGLTLQSLRIGWRMYCTGRIYGVGYAMLAPLRIPWSNLVNTLATLSAIYRYARARARREPLVWLKTEHAYPNRQSRNTYGRRLGEVLVDLGLVEDWEVDAALGERGEGVRLGEELVRRGKMSWGQLYGALAVQTGYEFETVDGEQVDRRLGRALPRAVMQEWELVVLGCDEVGLRVATSELPGEELLGAVRRYTGLNPHVVLVTPENLAELRERVEEGEESGGGSGGGHEELMGKKVLGKES